MLCDRAEYVIITPLGAEVDPDVYCKNATSVPQTCSSWNDSQSSRSLVEYQRNQAGQESCSRSSAERPPALSSPSALEPNHLDGLIHCLALLPNLLPAA